MAACCAGTSFESAVRVAATTAASTEAPGGAVTFARKAGYRPVIALTASKTETWTMAIVLTAGGVPGSFDAISAAFAFASVTTSAWAPAATASITTRSPIHVVIFISCLSFMRSQLVTTHSRRRQGRGAPCRGAAHGHGVGGNVRPARRGTAVRGRHRGRTPIPRHFHRELDRADGR